MNQIKVTPFLYLHRVDGIGTNSEDIHVCFCRHLTGEEGVELRTMLCSRLPQIHRATTSHLLLKGDDFALALTTLANEIDRI